MGSPEQKNILLTGGAGFIGSAFVRLAVEHGYFVTVLDALTYAGHLENLEHVSGRGRFDVVEGNIGDAALVATLLRERQIDWCLNFAAESHVDRSIAGPQDFIQTNIVGTFTLLVESLRYWSELPKNLQASFRFLQVSTDEVYGSLGETGYFNELTAMAPNSPYSASKAAGDHLVRAWHHTYGLPVLTTNCSNNYGPRQFPEKLIPHMLECAINDKPLPVYGDGKNVRDWIHVEDHCRGVLLALTRGIPGETYCFGGNAERRNLDVVTGICQELDRVRPRNDGKSYAAQITYVTDRLGHDRRYAIDSSKAERLLGFSRQYTFEQGLRNTVAWYLANRAWCQAVLKGTNHE